MNDFTPEDVTAMRQQGDFREFLRSISLPTQLPEPAAAPEPEPERDATRRPGAWPAGTRRPIAPVPAGNLTDWQAALDEYRAWDQAGRPKGNYVCECGSCPEEDPDD